MTDLKNTHVYHIGYTPGLKIVSIFFWGCSFACRGCICKKEIDNLLLKEHWHLFDDEPMMQIEKIPQRFLNLGEIMQALEGLQFDRVVLEGQEASLDPLFPQLTEALHKRFGTRNILATNAYQMPRLEHTDELQVGMKAFTNSIHRDYTGKSNVRVLKNIASLHQSGKKMTINTVFIPGYIEFKEIELVARFIAGIDRDIPFHILSYSKSGNNPWRRPTHDEIDTAVGLAQEHLNQVYGWKGDEEIKYAMTRII